MRAMILDHINNVFKDIAFVTTYPCNSKPHSPEYAQINIIISFQLNAKLSLPASHALVVSGSQNMTE